MPDLVLQTLTDITGKRRVHIFKRENGTFGFEEEYWSDDEFERCWIPAGRQMFSICDSQEIALREARGRIGWLSGEGGA